MLVGNTYMVHQAGPRTTRTGPGGQHSASVGVSCFDETPAQWRARTNYARECDGLPRLSDEELAIHESHVQHGNTLQAVKLEQRVMLRAFEAQRAAAAQGKRQRRSEGIVDAQGPGDGFF